MVAWAIKIDALSARCVFEAFKLCCQEVVAAFRADPESILRVKLFVVTGNPGAGKSHVLQFLRSYCAMLNIDNVLGSSTHMATRVVKGDATISKLLGLNFDTWGEVVKRLVDNGIVLPEPRGGDDGGQERGQQHVKDNKMEDEDEEKKEMPNVITIYSLHIFV